jgi:hypothetical protein
MKRIIALAVTGLWLALAAAPAGAQTVPGPSQFVRTVDNPWFPLIPGSSYRYRGSKDGKPAVDVMRVTRRAKTILGIRATVVADRLYLAGKLEERTSDWYAQDRAGNVWYLGEATAELDRHGRVKTTEGSWESGVDGALPGIFMPAHPRVGQSGRQEFLKGQAEDHFRVVDLRASVSVPFVTTSRALQTREWTPLEPGVLDSKYYVRGIGTVLEQTVRGGSELSRLVSFHRG